MATKLYETVWICGQDDLTLNGFSVLLDQATHPDTISHT